MQSAKGKEWTWYDSLRLKFEVVDREVHKANKQLKAEVDHFLDP